MSDEKTNVCEPLLTHRKTSNRHQNPGLGLVPGTKARLMGVPSARERPACGSGGARCKGGVSSSQALAWNRRTCRFDTGGQPEGAILACWPPRGRTPSGRNREGQSTAGTSEHVSFDFLGYTFRGRVVRGQRGFFVGFNPAMSAKAAKAVSQKIRAWHLNRRSATDLSDLAEDINAQVRGWIGYYGAFYRSRLYPIATRIDQHLVRWAVQKYKRLRGRPSGPGPGWMLSVSASPGSSSTGTSSRAPKIGLWEPGEGRPSRRVLREPGGAIPPATHLSFRRGEEVKGIMVSGRTALGGGPGAGTTSYSAKS